MPQYKKRNDNGPVPSAPVYDNPETKSLAQTLTEETEDAELREAKRAKREGFSESYTKAPWFTPMGE